MLVGEAAVVWARLQAGTLSSANADPPDLLAFRGPASVGPRRTGDRSHFERS